jgi:hypothetical protein
MSAHETPAETIRRAIEQMRATAQAATVGPWESVGGAFGDPSDGPDHMRGVRDGWSSAHDPEHTVARLEYDQQGGADGTHIASWHPAVALATADLLEGIADGHARILAMFPPDLLPTNVTAVYGFDAALRLARTYLGETP